jgi:hypothetical protein
MEALCGEQRVTDRSRLITVQQIKRNASLDYNTWLGMRKAGKGQSEDGARQDLHSLLFYLERVAEWKAVVGKLQCLLVEGADQSGRARTLMAARIKASLHSKASNNQRPSNQTHPIFPSWSEQLQENTGHRGPLHAHILSSVWNNGHMMIKIKSAK